MPPTQPARCRRYEPRRHNESCGTCQAVQFAHDSSRAGRPCHGYPPIGRSRRAFTSPWRILRRKHAAWDKQAEANSRISQMYPHPSPPESEAHPLCGLSRQGVDEAIGRLRTNRGIPSQNSARRSGPNRVRPRFSGEIAMCLCRPEGATLIKPRATPWGRFRSQSHKP